MIYVSQIIMLCTLNLHSAIQQLYLNKTEEKKKHKQGLKQTTVHHIHSSIFHNSQKMEATQVNQ